MTTKEYLLKLKDVQAALTELAKCSHSVGDVAELLVCAYKDIDEAAAKAEAASIAGMRKSGAKATDIARARGWEVQGSR